MENDLFERLHRGGDANGGRVFEGLAFSRLVLFDRGVEGFAQFGLGFGIGSGGAGDVARGDGFTGHVAEAGLRGFAKAVEVDAVDGIDLGLAGLGGHAGGGVVVRLGGAALFERRLRSSRFLLGRFGAIEGALVLHALGIKRLGRLDVLGLFDLGEELVDGKFGFAGASRLGGHGAGSSSAEQVRQENPKMGVLSRNVSRGTKTSH